MVQGKKQLNGKPKFAEVVIGDNEAKEMRDSANARNRRYITITASGFNTLSIYLCIRILKKQNYGNKGILRKGDVFRKPTRPSLPLRKAPPFSPSLSFLRDERM